MRPVILVTADRRDPGGHEPGPRVRPRRPKVVIGESYTRAVWAAGGMPLVVPPGATDLDRLMQIAHGVVITGGAFDIHPSLYGQQVTARLDRVEPDRTSLELALVRRCLTNQVPLLGICGGHQLLAVAAGGTLIQDLPGPPDSLEHEQPTDPAEGWHPVQLSPPLTDWLGQEVMVNSTHHQAVDNPGDCRIAGRSEDGVCEAIVYPEQPFAVGVQWHPELLGDLRLYEALVRAAR